MFGKFSQREKTQLFLPAEFYKKKHHMSCPNLSYLDSLMPKWANFSIKLQFQERKKLLAHAQYFLIFKFWHCFLFTTTFTLGSF